MILNRVKDIVTAAGQLALSQYGRDPGRLKEDGTWVTYADAMIEDFLRCELGALFATEAHIFGEEKGWTGSDIAPLAIIIDPIDGTELFRHQLPLWGISVAIFRTKPGARESWDPWMGIFSMPAANHVFSGQLGKGACMDGHPISVPAPPISVPPTSYLGVSSDGHRWGLQYYPGKIRAFGASGFHIVSVAAGMLQAALLTRFSFYDIAGAAIILWAAGGQLYYLSGKPVSPVDMIKHQKPPEPVLACHPDHFEETRSYIFMAKEEL